MLQFKRFTALILALLMAFSLFACGGPVEGSVPPVTQSAAPTPPPTFAPDPTSAPDPTQPPVDETTTLLESAYALGEGESLPYESTLTGTVLSVDTAWSDKYENITVTIQVGDHGDMPVMCFRLEGSGADRLRVGDVITVTGTLTNYKGTVEFAAGCRLEAVEGSAAPTPTPEAQPSRTPDRNGYYYDPESVVLYLHTYGKLPPNFITKDEARDLGWSGGSVERYRDGAAIGGDRFSNREGSLPTAKGRTYTECDMYTRGEDSRGACRLVFSNDGLYFYTDDHYETFTELYVTKDGEVKWK